MFGLSVLGSLLVHWIQPIRLHRKWVQSSDLGLRGLEWLALRLAPREALGGLVLRLVDEPAEADSSRPRRAIRLSRSASVMPVGSLIIGRWKARGTLCLAQHKDLINSFHEFGVAQESSAAALKRDHSTYESTQE